MRGYGRIASSAEPQIVLDRVAGILADSAGESAADVHASVHGHGHGDRSGGMPEG
jgi:hypothetical protein